MSSEIAIKVNNLSKCYQIYNQPNDRLKQFIVPKLCKIFPPLRKVFTNHHSPLPTYYKEFWALKDVSFEIKKGETVGIIGRNGSGKSTLLQMICGTLNPTSGSIQTHGRIAALLELGSGFNPEFTGRENVYMNAAVLGLSKEETDARFNDIIDFADIGDFIEQPVKTYSSGMVVRLAFAISVCVEPDILVIDEALAVGDAAFQFKCLDRMKILTESGTTLLFVSHDMSMVQSFCRNVIYLEHGVMKAQGKPDYIAELYFFDIRNEQRRNTLGKAVIKKDSINGSQLPAFGTEQGRIVKAYFLPDKSGTSVVGAGGSIQIHIEYEYDKSLLGVAASIYLNDRRMLDLAGKYFYLHPVVETDGQLVGAIEVEFEAKLKPGLYFITLRLESSRVGQSCFPIDKQPAALSFEVGNYVPEFLGTLDIGMKQIN